MKLLLLVLGFSLAACRPGPTDAMMSALANELQASFPAEINSVSFENAPPLDPPTLFIDMAPGMSPADELTFLCSSIGPEVAAVDARIDATTTYGYYLQTDCPSG